jgi:hypothetical protein
MISSIIQNNLTCSASAGGVRRKISRHAFSSGVSGILLSSEKTKHKRKSGSYDDHYAFDLKL